MAVHQRDDVQPESRHRRGDALVARVGSGSGDHRSGDQDHGQGDRAQEGQLAQRFRYESLRNPVIGLTDLHVEQNGQPDHRHRDEKVYRDGPPQQTRQHGDAADHGLRDRGGRHQPCVDLNLAAASGPRDGEHGKRRGQNHEEREQPVGEFDRLVHERHFRDRDGDEAAGKALRPGGAAQARRGDTDDRPGHGDAALGQDDRGGDDALDAQAGQGQHVDEPEQLSSDGHCPIVEERQLRAVVGERGGLCPR